MLTLVVTLFAANAMAWNPPATPAPASWISDSSGVLTPAAHARLDEKLKQVNQSSANEIAALIVPTLDGQDISDVANATFKAWGVGKKNLDNGVLVVLSMKEHKSRIETGKGVEGDLPDLKTQDILNNVVRPYMRKGDVEGALSHSFDAIASSIANHRAEVAARSTAGTAAGTGATTTTAPPANGPSCTVGTVGASDDGGSFWLVTFLLLGGGLGAWWLVARSRKRQAERLAELAEQTERLRREQATRRRVAEDARLRREREASFSNPTPAVHVPVVTRPSPPPPPVVTRPVAPVMTVTPVVAAVAVAAELEREREEERARARRAAERRASDEEDARRRRRESDEEDARRRRRDEESSSSSSSSSSWGGGSDSGGSGGFGGGDSGGGGSSSDW